MRRTTIQPYTSPEMSVYPDDAPILIAGIIAVLMMPVVFLCFLVWGQI